MYLEISRRVSLAVLCCSLGGLGAHGQSQKTGSVSKEESAALSLRAARDNALQSGNATAIAETSRPYLAELLAQLGRVDAAASDQGGAVSAYKASFVLQDSPSRRLEFGLFLLRTGKPEDAVVQFKVAVEESPSPDPNAFVSEALAYRAMGDNAKAAESFSRALQLKEDINVAYALASALLLERKKEKAESLFQQIFSASSGAAIWHVAAGDAYRTARYYSDAVDEFKKAISIDPHVPHAEFFLGLTYLQMNEWGPSSESFNHLRKAVAQSPKEYTSNFYLGALESTDGSDLVSSDRHLRAAAEADPTQPEVWIYLGQNANREHDDVTAEKDLRRSIELTGTHESTNNYQVRRAYSALGRLLIAKGRREEGAGFLAKYRVAEQASLAASSSTISSMGSSSTIDPSAARPPAVMEGVVLPAEQSSATAPQLTPMEKTQLLKQSGALKHLIAEAFNDLGTAQARQQNYADALRAFLDAEQWETPTPVLLRNIGMAAFRLSDFSQAARALSLYREQETKAGEIRNDAPAVQRTGLMLGLSYFNLGKFKEAAAAFSSVHDTAMGDPRAAYSWAFSLARIGRAKEADRIAGQLQSQPLPPTELSLVCHIYMDDENYEGALSCFRKAYQLDSSLQLAHYEAGQALVHLDRPQEAVAEIEQEEKMFPGNPNVQYSLAYALLQASRKDEAQTLFQQITTEHPDNAEAQYQLGKLLLEEGKTTDAVAHLEASERASAAPDYVHYQLGIAYKKAGMQSDADRELKLYRELKDKKRESSSVPASQTR